MAERWKKINKYKRCKYFCKHFTIKLNQVLVLKKPPNQVLGHSFLWSLNFYFESQSFICTKVLWQRVHWQSVSPKLNCCGTVSGCITEQVVPLCLSLFARVKLPPLPSSILSSSLQLCPSINLHTLSEPTPSWNNTGEKARQRERIIKHKWAWAGTEKKTDTSGPAYDPHRQGAFHLPSASELICWQKPWCASPSIAQASRNTNVLLHPT